MRRASSRRSPTSERRAVEARRTESANGAPSPVETSSASERTSASILARCTAVACGTETPWPRSALESAPRSISSFFNGSGRRRPTHETSGHPVARPARQRVERSTASTIAGTPAPSASADSRASTRSSDRARVGASPAAARSSPAAARTSASMRPAVIRLSATRFSISPLSWSMPMPWRAEIAITGTSGMPSAASRRRTSSTIASRRSSGTVSMWLSTTTITSACVRSGAR